MPGIPSVFSHTGAGAKLVSILVSASPGTVAYSWAPVRPVTESPTDSEG